MEGSICEEEEGIVESENFLKIEIVKVKVSTFVL